MNHSHLVMSCVVEVNVRTAILDVSTVECNAAGESCSTVNRLQFLPWHARAQPSYFSQRTHKYKKKPLMILAFDVAPDTLQIG